MPKSDWIYNKAGFVLSSFSWTAKSDGDPVEVVAQALREAEARGRSAGMERAAEICDKAHESNFSCELVAEMIRDAAKDDKV